MLLYSFRSLARQSKVTHRLQWRHQLCGPRSLFATSSLLCALLSSQEKVICTCYALLCIAQSLAAANEFTRETVSVHALCSGKSLATTRLCARCAVLSHSTPRKSCAVFPGCSTESLVANKKLSLCDRTSLGTATGCARYAQQSHSPPQINPALQVEGSRGRQCIRSLCSVLQSPKSFGDTS